MRYDHTSLVALQFTASPSSGDEIKHFQVNATDMQVVGFYPSTFNDHICMRVELYGCVPGRLLCCLVIAKATWLYREWEMISGYIISRARSRRF